MLYDKKVSDIFETHTGINFEKNEELWDTPFFGYELNIPMGPKLTVEYPLNKGKGDVFMAKRLGKYDEVPFSRVDARGYCGCACTCSKFSKYFTEGCEAWVTLSLISPSEGPGTK